jgi:hypothetical protein
MNVRGDQPVTKRLARDQRKTRAAKPRVQWELAVDRLDEALR